MIKSIKVSREKLMEAVENYIRKIDVSKIKAEEDFEASVVKYHEDLKAHKTSLVTFLKTQTAMLSGKKVPIETIQEVVRNIREAYTHSQSIPFLERPYGPNQSDLSHKLNELDRRAAWAERDLRALQLSEDKQVTIKLDEDRYGSSYATYLGLDV